jgi:hypothetical protein
MVRAILEGRKTQTRRIVKPSAHVSINDGGIAYWGSHCPYGQPGDRLWVRETWRPMGDLARLAVHIGCDPDGVVAYKADDDGSNVLPWRPAIHMPRWASRLTLEITNVRVERLQDISEEDAQAEGVKTVWTGRSELPCGGVANAEFINYEPPAGCELKDIVQAQTFRNRFAQLWDSINGVGSWDANPWVWVVEFKVVQP